MGECLSGVDAEPVDVADGINDEVDTMMKWIPDPNGSDTLQLCNEVQWRVVRGA